MLQRKVRENYQNLSEEKNKKHQYALHKAFKRKKLSKKQKTKNVSMLAISMKHFLKKKNTKA